MGNVPQFSSYCNYVATLGMDNHHRVYHDTEYGFPQEDDTVLFERLVLEINQAGLSWDTILKKRAGFKQAYCGFNIERVANFSTDDVERLLQDASIIRNRMKVLAAISNAQAILVLQSQHGSFKQWLNECHPLPKEEWVKVFKKTFKFTGGEIVGEFLMSLGYLPNAHVPECPTYAETIRLKPMWHVSPL